MRRLLAVAFSLSLSLLQCGSFLHQWHSRFMGKTIAVSTLEPRIRSSSRNVLASSFMIDEISKEIDSREFVSFNNAGLTANRISQKINFFKSEFQRYSLLQHFLQEEALLTNTEEEYMEDFGYFDRGIDKLWDDIHLMVAVIFGFRVKNGSFAWDENLLPKGMDPHLPRRVKQQLKNETIPNFRRIILNDDCQLTEFLESTLPPEPQSNEIIIDTLMGTDYSQSMKYEILIGLNKTESRPNPVVIKPSTIADCMDGTPQTNDTTLPPPRAMEMIPDSELTPDEQLLKEYFLRVAYRKRLLVQWLYSFGILGEYHPEKAVVVDHLIETIDEESDDSSENDDEDDSR
jgi:hypothetical protein